MVYGICVVIGIVTGILFGWIGFYTKAAYGYFKIEPVPDEEDLYTVNMRLLPDQNLKKRTRIVLTRE
mgnify:CR=1 FL=1